jgi:uncharacterized repeat protein (TIGR02543 family)
MMVAVAVAASLVAYAWIINYLNFTTAKSGKAIQIQAVGIIGANLKVYVQNIGQGSVQFVPNQCVYIDGALFNNLIDSNTLSEGETATITVGDQAGLAGQMVKIRIVTSDGIFMEATAVPTSGTEGLQQHVLSLNYAGTGTGLVSLDPSGGIYFYGQVVTLTAVPVVGSTFIGWGGDLSGADNPETIIMDGPKSMTATFSQNEYMLNIIVAPLVGGSVTPDISPPYHYGDVVVLTESPNSGYTFSGWTGDGIGSGVTRTVTIDDNKAVTATFTLFTGIFEDGFESGDFSAWTATTGTPSVVSTTSHHGTYSMETNANDEYVRKTITGTRTVFTRFYVKFDNLPTTGQFGYLVHVAVAGVSNLHALGLYNDGTNIRWRMFYLNAGSFYVVHSTQQQNPSTQTWYCIELKTQCSSADGQLDGEYRVYINGIELTDISQTNIDTDVTQVTCAWVGNGAGLGSIWFPNTGHFDCVVVSDIYIGPEV